MYTQASGKMSTFWKNNCKVFVCKALTCFWIYEPSGWCRYHFDTNWQFDRRSSWFYVKFLKRKTSTTLDKRTKKTTLLSGYKKNSKKASHVITINVPVVETRQSVTRDLALCLPMILPSLREWWQQLDIQTTATEQMNTKNQPEIR